MLLKLLYTSDTRRSLHSRPLYTAVPFSQQQLPLSSLIPGTRANAATDTRATVIPSLPGIPAFDARTLPFAPPSLLNSALHDSPRVPAPAILAPTTKRKKLCASVPLSLRNSVLMRLPHAQALSHYRPTRLSASLCLSSLLLHTNTHTAHTHIRKHPRAHSTHAQEGTCTRQAQEHTRHDAPTPFCCPPPRRGYVVYCFL